MARSKPEEWPLLVKSGAAVVKIYRVRRGDGWCFQVEDFPEGKRVLRSFTDLEAARKRAKVIADTKRGTDVILLKGGQARAYSAALELLKPTGLSLVDAAALVTDAHGVLGGPLIPEAARFYAKRNPAKLPQRLVAEVREELLAAKLSAGSSSRYVEDLRHRLGKLSEAFAGPVSAIDGRRLQEWLDGLSLSAQSLKNYRQVLGLFARFAKRRGYLPKDWDELDSVEWPKVRRTGGAEIFTPGEMVKLLKAAPTDFALVLAIGGFAGLRSAEILRLEWPAVDLGRGFIEVTAGTAKTASRRLAPVLPNLAEWLRPHVQSVGLVFPGGAERFKRARADTVAGAEVAWKANALRHSFISYRLAVIQDAARVSLEAGNSPAMVFAHYRELVTPEATAEWFAIVPTNERAARFF